VPDREKRSRSIREDHGTLDVRCQVSLRHSAHLRVIDLFRRGRRRPEYAAPTTGTRAPGSGCIISIRRFLLKIGSMFWDLHPHRQDCSGHPDQNIHPPTLTGVSSSSSSASIPNPNSSDDYPEIGASACEEPAEGGHLIYMVALNDDRSHNYSSRYPTIGRSEASDAQTPSGGLVQNLNPDINAVRVQAIMETIQHMAPDGSPLAALAQ
jgi:hypothetical protein